MLPPAPPTPAWPPAQPLAALGAAALWWAPPGFGKRSRLRQLLGDRPCTWLGAEEGPEALAERLGLPLDSELLLNWLEAQGEAPAALVLHWAPWAKATLGAELLASWPLEGHPQALVLLAEAPLLQPEAMRLAVAAWPQVGPSELAYPEAALGPWLEAQGQKALRAKALWQQSGGWAAGLALAQAGQAAGLPQAWAEQVMPSWPASWQALAQAAASWGELPARTAELWGAGAWAPGLVQGGAFLPEGGPEAWAWRPVARQGALWARAQGPWWRGLPWASQGPVLASLFEAEDQAEAWRVGQDLGWRQAWRAVRQLEALQDEASWCAWPAAQLLAAQVALESGQEALAQRHLARLPATGEGQPAGMVGARALLLAQLALGQGRFEEAQEALAAAEASAPEEALVWAIAQARVFLALGEGRLSVGLTEVEALLARPEPASPAARRTRLELLALAGSQRAFWGPLAQGEAHLRSLLAELELQPSLSEGLGLKDLAASALASCLALQGRGAEAREALALAPEEGEGGIEALLHRARALGLLGEAAAEALWQEALAQREGQPGWAWPAWEWRALRPQGAPAELGAKALQAAEAGGPLLRGWGALEAVAQALAQGAQAEAEARWASLPEGEGLAEAYRQALGHRLGRLPAPPASPEAQAVARLRPLGAAAATAPVTPAAAGPSLQLFGPASLSVEGSPVTKWPRRQARMLLLALGLHPTGVHRSQLLAWLWPHMEEAGASAQLHNATATLRAALEPSLPPRAPSQHLIWLGQRLRLKGVSTDLQLAEQQWETWQSAQGGKGPQARQLALTLLSLPPLGGDEPWPDAWQVLRHRWGQRQALVADWVAGLPEASLELQAAVQAFRTRA